jgi:hypothetical protein
MAPNDRRALSGWPREQLESEELRQRLVALPDLEADIG